MLNPRWIPAFAGMTAWGAGHLGVSSSGSPVARRSEKRRNTCHGFAVAAVVSILLASVVFAPPALAQTSDDLALVLTRALYPVQLLAYCDRSVIDDPLFVEIASDWNARNAGLLANIERLNEVALEAGRGIDTPARVVADEATLAEITATVQAQADPVAYCRTIAGFVDAGRFDIDRRGDLEAPLKRLFGLE